MFAGKHLLLLRMKMTRKTETGRKGEDLVFRYLVKNKYKIFKRNYREKFDEIDIIAKSIDGTLVFCEVKTFFNESDSGSELVPEDNLTKAKFKKISRACEMFAGKHQDLVNEKMGWRIDCAVVVLSESGNYNEIRYYENIDYNISY
jgi:putative endonuclease